MLPHFSYAVSRQSFWQANRQDLNPQTYMGECQLCDLGVPSSEKENDSSDGSLQFCRTLTSLKYTVSLSL